jgi:hypothetical protein
MRLTCPCLVQVFATHATLGTAYSAMRPIQASVVRETARDPMGNSVLEQLVVGTSWSLFARLLLYGVLGSHICLLVLARVLRDRLAPPCMPFMHATRSHKTSGKKNGHSLHVGNGGVGADAARHAIVGNANHTDGDTVAALRQRHLYRHSDVHTHAGEVSTGLVANGGAAELQNRAWGATFAVRGGTPLTYMQCLFAAVAHALQAVAVVVMAPLRQHAELARCEIGWWGLMSYLMLLAVGPTAVFKPLDHSSASLYLVFTGWQCRWGCG